MTSCVKRSAFSGHSEDSDVLDMKHYTCNDCGAVLNRETRNTVTVKNMFNQPVKLHYCAACALERWPELESMIGWTKPLRQHPTFTHTRAAWHCTG